MSKINVFMSSSMTGELDSERENLITQFEYNPDISKYYHLIHILNHARPKNIEKVFTDEVKQSQLMILLLYNELRDAVVKEYETAVNNKVKILCYVKDSNNRSKDMVKFIDSLNNSSPVVYLKFKNSIDLTPQLISDLKKDLLDTYKFKSFSESNLDIISLPTNFDTQFRVFTLDSIKNAANEKEIRNSNVDELITKSIYLIYEQYRYKDALMLLEIASLREPDNWMVLNNKAQLLDLMGLSDAALFLYKKSIDLHPSEVGYYNLGNILYHKNRVKEAIEAFQESLKMSPQKVSSLDNLVNCYFKIWDVENALKTAKLSYSINKNELSIGNYAVALLLNGNYTKGEKIYNTLDKTSDVYHRVKGHHYFATNDFETALLEYETVLSSGDSDYHSAIRKFYCLVNLNEINKAIEWIHYLEKQYPIQAEDYNQIGWTLSNNHKRHEESISLFEKAVEINPYYTDAWASLEFAFYQINKPDKMLEVCNQALQYNPFDQRSIHNKTVLLAETGRFEDAIKFTFRKNKELTKPNITDEEVEIEYNVTLAKMGITAENYSYFITLMSKLYSLFNIFAKYNS